MAAPPLPPKNLTSAPPLPPKSNSSAPMLPPKTSGSTPSAPPIPPKSHQASNHVASPPPIGAPPPEEVILPKTPVLLEGISIKSIIQGQKQLLANSVDVQLTPSVDPNTGLPFYMLETPTIGIIAYVATGIPSLCTKALHYLFFTSGTLYLVIFPKMTPAATLNLFETVLASCSYFEKLDRPWDEMESEKRNRYATALAPYETSEAHHLTFQRDDVIQVMKMENPDWWWGKIKQREGWFPANFVSLQSEDTAKNLNKGAQYIAKGGRNLGIGIVKGAHALGNGMSKGANYIVSNTEKGNEEKVSAEHQERIDNAKNATSTVLTGTRKAMVGIGKGTMFLGGKAKEAVVNSDAYKRHEENSKPSHTKDAAANVGKASIGAIKDVFVGAKDGVVITSGNVRDSTVQVVEHKKGSAVAEATGRSMNIAGDGVLATWNITRIAATTTTGGFVLATAIDGATFKSGQEFIESGSWLKGHVSIKHWVIPTWSTRFLYAKSSALLWYTHQHQTSDVKADGFLEYSDVYKVENLPDSDADGHPYRFGLRVSNHLMEIACSTREEKELWMNVIPSLKMVIGDV